jgi:hypothetical protein
LTQGGKWSKKNISFGLYHWEKTVQRKIIRTTLGELVVAVTDEVKRFIRDPWARHTVVAWVLSDLLAHQQARKRSRHKPRSRLADVLY